MTKNRKNKKIVPASANAFDKAIILWTAPEFLRYRRGLIWKTAAFLLFACIMLFAFLQKAWSFGLVMLVSVAVYYLLQRERPRNLEVKISDIGIKVGQRQYPFTRIKGFWIIYEPPFATLNISVSGDLAANISIQLAHQDPAVLRNFLLHKIPELEGKKESFLDLITKILKI